MNKIEKEIEYLHGKKNGIEKIYNPYRINEFEYINGKKSGKGKEYKYGKLKFEGEFLNGKKWNGKGFKYFQDYKISEIEYLNGKKWNGKVYDEEGKIYIELKNGCSNKFKKYKDKCEQQFFF